MKKFSDKINEGLVGYISKYQRDEIEFLLSTLDISLEDTKDIFINFLDKGDYDFGINLDYHMNNQRWSAVNIVDLNKDKIQKITLTFYYQMSDFNRKSYYSDSTKEKGFYSLYELDLIEEYIFSIKTLSAISKNSKITFNTLIEKLNVIIEFENSDEILDGLKEVIKNK